MYRDQECRDAVAAVKKGDRGTVHRKEDKTFLLSSLMCRDQATKQTKNPPLLNIESVQDHAYMLIKTSKRPKQMNKTERFPLYYGYYLFLSSSDRK